MCLSLSVNIRLKFFSLVGGRRNGSSFPRGNTSGERMRGRRRRGKTECDIGPWRRPLKDTPCPCPSMDRMRRPWPRFTSNKVAITIGYIGVVRRLHCARDNPDGSSCRVTFVHHSSSSFSSFLLGQCASTPATPLSTTGVYARVYGLITEE